MRALTLDDLLPLGDYAGQRRQFFTAHCRYLDRYRRVPIGPGLTLVFENRQTLWFRVQELLRIARLADPILVQEELNVYNRLLPGRDRLQGVLIIAITDEARLTEELAFWQSLPTDGVRLRIGEQTVAARIVTCRPEDRCMGAVHWVQFDIDGNARRLLRNFRQPAFFEVAHPNGAQQSP